jgi:signal transduction histidine kinase
VPDAPEITPPFGEAARLASRHHLVTSWWSERALGLIGRSRRQDWADGERQKSEFGGKSREAFSPVGPHAALIEAGKPDGAAETVERERALSSQVSHQLRTPLAAMRLAIETEMADPRTRWQPSFATERRTLEVDIHDASGYLSKTALNQILDVLLGNSLRHGRGRARISIGTGDEYKARIRVSDDGFLDSNRNPFDTPRTGGHGTGLKLARSLAETERSALRLASARPVAFELTMPRTDPSGPSTDLELEP